MSTMVAGGAGPAGLVQAGLEDDGQAGSPAARHPDDVAEYAQLRRTLSHREGELSRARASSRRAEAARSLALLRPGDIIRVPGGRRAGLAVVLQPGLHQARGASAARDHGGRRAPAGSGNGRSTGPGPLVLTEGRQVKRLATADFPVPPEVIDAASSAIAWRFLRTCRARPTTPRSAWNCANEDSRRAEARARPAQPVRLTAML